MMRTARNTALLGLFVSATAAAAPAPARIVDCVSILDGVLRLACYDELSGKDVATATAVAAAVKTGAVAGSAAMQAAVTETAAAPLPPESRPSTSVLARHWENGIADKHGLFAFRPHNDNYLLLAKYNVAPNNTPFNIFRGTGGTQNTLQHSELAFQLSFKMKLLEDISSQHADLWFGYTQQSFWQAYNASASRPFRDTNYQPELIASIPAKFNLLGVQSQFVNFGLVHQSNGQVATLSRSWNRIYAQAGVESGDVTAVLRVWKRLDNGVGNDNPDIIDYLGRGDLVVNYRPGKQRFTLLQRHSFSTGRGATQLGWVTPVKGDLKGYVQLFSGYGQSLIDYNAYQRTIGVGVMIDY